MEPGRVVVVQSTGGSLGLGSGYVVGPRLVLTSAHAVPEPGAAVQVLVAADPVAYDGVVLWRGEPGGRADAALVEVRDAAWVPRPGRVRWGRVVTNQPGIATQAWGFPALAQRASRPAETLHPSGTLNPGNRYVGDRYVMALSGYPPTPTADGSSPWAGLSGAALFCGDLLTGVVTADPTGTQHAQIEATPVYLLHRDAGFRAARADQGISEPVLEPVELQHLIEPETDLVRAPASLLRARHQVVPFRGRERLLQDLTAWAQGSGVAGCLVHGPGGQGKTRLAQELARRLTAERWAFLWLRADTTADDMAVLADVAVPLLMIVDYAEARPGQVTAALRAAAGHAGRSPWRMLLLARTAGDWWEDLRASDAHASELLEGAPVVRLEPLEPEPSGQVEAYRQAVRGFADALPALPGQQQHDWAAVADRLIGQSNVQADAPSGEPSTASESGWGVSASALTLHMSALADLLDAVSPPDSVVGTGGAAFGDEDGGGFAPAIANRVEDRLLHHERRYWTSSANTYKLALGKQTLEDALTAAFLLGASDTEDADALLHRVPGLSDQPRDRRDSVRQWITHLYPPSVPGRPWDSLQPDRLAERFIGTRLATHLDRGSISLLDDLVDGSGLMQAGQLLTVYARAAHHPAADSRLSAALTNLCIRHPDVLAVPAVQVATQTEGPDPLVAALRQLAGNPSVSCELLEALTDALPSNSRNLLDAAAELTQRLTTTYRGWASSDPDTFLPDLAGSLNNLSNRLANLGRREEALEAITEAVAVHRQLAAVRPDTFLPDLAGSLNNLSVRLSDLGQREEALEAIIEASDTYRQLAAARPDTFLPDLAMSLNNLSNNLGDLGQREEALEAIIEASDTYRQLAAARPDAFLPDLAISLNNLSNRLGDLGRREEALEAITEAVAVRRQLAAARPDAFLPDLAGSLNNLSNRLGDLGRREEALKAITEAVAVRRQLAAARPDAFLPYLAGSLNNLSNRLSEFGRREEALEAITEAVAVRRQLAAARPDAFLPYLAGSLNNLSSRLGEFGRREEALEAITEAVAIRRQLAAARPDAFLPNLAGSLNNLSNNLGNLGRREEALEAITEAVAIRRQLAAARPDAFLPDLAGSLNNLSNRLSEFGRREEALEAITEAVAIRRQLAAARPEAFLPDLAMSLNNLSNNLGEFGRHEEALEAIIEASDTYRQLAAARPEAFLPNLAMSLNNLSHRLSEFGRHEEALEAITEAVAVRRQLAAARPEAFLPDLAGSLNNLSNRLSEFGRREEALEAITEAVAIRRQLAAARPEAFLPDLAMSLNNLSVRLSDLGRHEEALEAIIEASDTYRQLAAARPEAFLPYLVGSLNNLSNRLGDLGQQAEALKVITESVNLLGDLADRWPSVYEERYAEALNTFGKIRQTGSN
ncbi:tetratricopeptide repeat protein [Kineococcus sp. SYSU DK006]|uniref:tetratricopeptide repeat protein n=1 Tax=Kineococcus sp. SYSU DK006 TaxID=3383127 RepID=UPI003D7E0456